MSEATIERVEVKERPILFGAPMVRTASRCAMVRKNKGGK